MNTFDIDSEIDKLVEKFSDELKTRLKKIVSRSEKLLLKQYITSQKNTAPKKSKFSSSSSSNQRSSSAKEHKNLIKSPRNTKNNHARYKDEDSYSE